MKLKKSVVTACAILCIGTALPVIAFAKEAAPVESKPAVQSVSTLSAGRKEGLKFGLKDGLKNGLAFGLKSGLTSGAKDGLKNGLTAGLKSGLKDGEKR